MGGHSAWRKRLERGELAKQSSGAICRHRPHFGRKGKDLVKNRKGNIGGGNPKKSRRAKQGKQEYELNKPVSEEGNVLGALSSVILVAVFVVSLAAFRRLARGV